MDVWGARAPEAAPLPCRTPPVGPPDTWGCGRQPKPAPPGIARAGGSVSCLPPTSQSRPAPCFTHASAQRTAPPGPPDTRRRGRQPPWHRPASPALARPRPARSGPARPHPASPILTNARPACPRHCHLDPGSASHSASTPPTAPSGPPDTRRHGRQPPRPRPASPSLAPMYLGMADAHTPPLKKFALPP